MKKKGRGCDLLFLIVLVAGIMWVVPNREKIISRFSDEKFPVNTESEQAWSLGGTLHEGRMAEWSDASYENRLATSAGLVSDLLESAGKEPPSDEAFKTLAVQLEQTMSAANQNRRVDDKDVATVAETCWILMQNN